MDKRLICVIFGGESSEYQVSLRSAYSVLNALDKDKYQIVKIGITKKGKWYLYEGDNEKILKDTWHDSPLQEITIDFNSGAFISRDKRKIKPYNTLIVMHGENAEDGRIQSCLDLAKINYVGPDPQASGVCMNKHLTKLFAKALDIRVARDVLVTCDNYQSKEIQNEIEKISYPVFVKPTCQGSSVGVTRVEKREDLENALEKALSYSKSALVEEYINGVETEVAILEKDHQIIAIESGQLSYKESFYTYEEKYKNKNTKYQIPSKIDEKTEKSLKECSKKLFFALGLKDLSRLDFFITKENKIIFNEVNTLPGMTDISMYPMLLNSKGISFTKMLDILLEKPN